MIEHREILLDALDAYTRVIGNTLAQGGTGAAAECMFRLQRATAARSSVEALSAPHLVEDKTEEDAA